MNHIMPRPRVAAIGLSDSQVASIELLCGTLRPELSLEHYLGRYNWTETDIVVATDLDDEQIHSEVNILTIGKNRFLWRGRVSRNYATTERELSVPDDCPELYKHLAANLCTQLNRSAQPPDVVDADLKYKDALIKSTSGRSIALRLVYPVQAAESHGEQPGYVTLMLPYSADLTSWFRAFLCDIHAINPEQVPEPPPSLSQALDWYTPQERFVADEISRIEAEIECLNDKRSALETELIAERERADEGVRKSLWADGSDLIDAVREMLSDIGFVVRDMDAELIEGEPRREDLRLSLARDPEWQALVEVKGYTSGIRTNDARQIREHRDRYIREEGHPPALTVWLSNPYRKIMDPSSRPIPGRNVDDAANYIGSVHVLASDLYRRWALVAAGDLDAESVVESLMNADPGLWIPPDG